MRRLFTTAVTALALAMARATAAQSTAPLQRDVLGGFVLGPHGPVPNATVTVRSVGGAPDAPTASARTDEEGRWLTAILDGTGEYTVRAIAFGYRPNQVTARRGASYRPIQVDIRLEALPALLDPVRVTAQQRPRPSREIMAQDRAGADRATDNFRSAIATGDQGNLAAMAASVPGVLLVPDAGGGPAAFSVLGLSTDQNRVTLNGLSFSAADIPRDAIVTTRANAATFDVARGGFSGAQLSVSLAPGGNFHTRTARLTVDHPSLQTGAVNPVGGRAFRNTQLSGSLAGPIRLNKAFYNAAFQVGRRTNDIESLVAASPAELRQLGIGIGARDSLLGAATAVGLLATPAGLPERRLADNASVLGRLDWFRSRTVLANLTISARTNQVDGAMVGPAALASTGAHTRASGADVIAALSTYLPGSYLNDLRLGIRANRATSAPYASLPAARILTSAGFERDTSSAPSITTLFAGGNAALPRTTRTWGAEVYDVLARQSIDRQHRLRITTDLRFDGVSDRFTPNPLGTYTFDSIDDLASNRPSAFARTLGARSGDVDALAASIAIGDDYRPRDRVQLLYGVRIDANRFTTHPAHDRDIETAFGVRTDFAPAPVTVSPRVGFFRAFGTNGQTGIPGFGAPWGSVRGGIGLFRNDITPSLLMPAVLSTKPGAERLLCVGPATPVPDWPAFSQDPTAIPSTCAGTVASPYVAPLRNLTLVDPAWTPQRSWRANLAINAFLIPKRVRATVEGVYSLSLGQQNLADLNFNGVPRFTLPDEGARPVFVAASSIVPSSGAVTPRDSRRDARFGAVSSITSDLRSEARQLLVTVVPAPGDQLGRFTDWKLAYTLQHVRDQSRGFSGTTGGDPTSVEWGRASLDARHQVTASVSTRFGSLFSIATSAHVTSGLPYTPVVAGDVNGDGFSTDRAFVFGPEAPDAMVGASMRALLASAPARARDCLTRQTGRVAARSSCEGPWTATWNAAAVLNPQRLGWDNRVQLSLSVTNVLAGFDQALHGDAKLRGWGQPGVVDPTLLTVRGFDPAALRYRYAVNPLFGSTRGSLPALRRPFSVTLEARVELGRELTAQAVDQLMAVRASHRVTVDQLKGELLQSVFNPVRGLVQARDSLTILTSDQARALAALERRVTAEQDSIVTPLARGLVGGEFDRVGTSRVVAAVLEVEQRLFDAVVRGMREARTLFTPEQIDEFPPALRASFDIARLQAARPVRGFEPNY